MGFVMIEFSFRRVFIAIFQQSNCNLIRRVFPLLSLFTTDQAKEGMGACGLKEILILVCSIPAKFSNLPDFGELCQSVDARLPPVLFVSFG